MMLRITSIVTLCVLLSDARKFDDGAKGTYWNEIQENIEARKTKELDTSVEFFTRSIGFDDIRLNRIQYLQNLPPAVIARYVVNQAGN